MTTPSAKADGFLGYARTNVPRYVPNAQSERTGKNITGGVDITVNDQPTGARVNTVSKSFRNIRQASALGTHLRSVVGVDPDKLPTSILYFVGELGKEHPPTRIVDRTSEHPPGQSFDVQILDSDKSVVIGQLPAEFMMKIRPLVADVSVSLLEQPDSLPSPDATLLTPGDLPLNTAQISQSSSEITGIVYQFAIGEGGEGIKTYVNANRTRRRYKVRHIDNHTETGIPLPSITLQRQRFNVSSDRAVHLQFDSADSLHFYPACFGQVTAVSLGWKTVAVKSVPGLETGIACFFTCLNPAEESLKCFVNPPEHVLAGGVIGEGKVARIPYFFKLAGLVVVIKTNLLHPPRLTSLLKRSIIQGTGFPKLVLKGNHLFSVWIKAIFKSPALHLLTFLRLNVMLDCRSCHTADTGDVIRPTPKGRQPRAKAGEFSTKYLGTKTFELCHNMCWCLCRLRLYEKVNVVRHYLKAVYNSLHLIRLLTEKFLQSISYITNKHRPTVLWTPNQMILQGKYRPRIKPISLFYHALSVTHSNISVKYLM